MQKTKNILEDIYKIDPELKNHDKNLKKILDLLLEVGGEVKPDEDFVLSLKQKIMNLPQPGKPWYLDFFTLKQLSYSGSFAVIAVLLTIVYQDNILDKQNKLVQQNIESVSNISRMENKESMVNQDTAGFPGDIYAKTGGYGGVVAPLLYSPTIANYKYEKNLNDLTLEYKPTIELEHKNTYDLPEEFKNFFQDKFGEKSVENSKIQNFSIVQDKPYGYVFNYSVFGLSIDPNYETWPSYGRECMDASCYDKYKITKDMIPADKDIIAIAEQFLKEYKIPYSGKGKVLDEWKVQYELSPEKNTYNFPESLPVVFPYEFNGLQTVNSLGDYFGITLFVNIREKRVQFVSNILSLEDNEVSKKYIDDKDKILKPLLEKGGVYGNSGAENTLKLNLLEPEYVYIYRTSPDSNFQKSYFVPGLRFKVENPTFDSQRYVTVPLVEEFLGYNSNMGIMEKSAH